MLPPKIEDLTDNRIVIVGTSGELEDSANLTFDGAEFNVGSAVSIYASSGIVKINTSFYGDGSNLSGVTGHQVENLVSRRSWCYWIWCHLP